MDLISFLIISKMVLILETCTSQARIHFNSERLLQEVCHQSGTVKSL